MKRRSFMWLLGGTLALSPMVHAQQGGIRRIGVLMNVAESDPEGQAELAALRQRLREIGWIEGRNLNIEYRWTVGSADRARALATELVGKIPDVILVFGGTTTSALLQETRSVPVVFVGGIDPVAAGFVSSLARPGGNTTGFTGYEPTMGTKWLELLKEIAPAVSRVLILKTENPQSSILLPAIEAAAESIGVRTIIASIHDAAEIERAIGAHAGEANIGLLELPSTVAFIHRDLIIALAARYRLPAVYENSAFPRSGGLISYSFDRLDQFRRAAGYVDRILRGEKPGDLPVQAPTKFELVINMKSAAALGLAVPQTLQTSADEVIE